MGSKTRDVVVVPYDPEWPVLFARLRDRAWPVVRDIARAIEHVGSTSVPGLDAKPIVDLDVIVPERATATAIARLATVGYAHQGNLDVEGREAFRAPAGNPPHNLYVAVDGGPAVRNHLAFRDHLRAHPEEARAYAAIKRELAARFPRNIDAYVEGKTSFIVGVLERLGFSRGELETAVRINVRSNSPAPDVRDAHPSEASALTELALRSKAHWPYDAAFLAAARPALTIDAALIARATCRVATRGGAMIGFYLLAVDDGVPTLRDLWLEPAAIGSGAGRALWDDMIAAARRLGYARVRIESDPNAAGPLLGPCPTAIDCELRLPDAF